MKKYGKILFHQRSDPLWGLFSGRPEPDPDPGNTHLDPKSCFEERQLHIMNIYEREKKNSEYQIHI